MSAIHTGSVAARLTADGLWQYSGTSEDHAVTGWPALGQSAQVLIPKQRAGNAYETTVLKPSTDDTLSDLSDLVYIPSLRGFVKEVSGGQDVPQTANHTAGGDPR